MNTKTNRILLGALAVMLVDAVPMQSANADSYLFTRTAEPPYMIERVMESPVVIESSPTLTEDKVIEEPVVIQDKVIDEPVVIEDKVIEKPVVIQDRLERPVIIKEERWGDHHLLNLHVFPLGHLDVF